MRILQFGKYYPPAVGGIETVTYNITEGLNEIGIQCDVLCFDEQNQYREDRCNGYTVYRIGSFGKYASVEMAPGVFRKFAELANRYDVIQIHMPNPLANLAVFFARPHAKIALYWHSDILKQATLLKLYNPFLTWLIKRADLIIGATRSHVCDSDHSALFTSKCAVIPYVFNSREFCEDMIDPGLLAKLSGQFRGKKIIFSVGRLIYYKGFEYLIRSARHLDDDCLILIGGAGDQQERLRAIIDGEALRGRVVLLGRIKQEELPTYYKLCDIFCLPSVYRTEMFGMVQLEAMAFGKPVVSTRIERSGVSLVNRDGVTGLVVEPGNEEMLAGAFKRLLSDERLYRRMSQNAKQVVAAKYSREKIIPQLILAYRSILGN